MKTLEIMLVSSKIDTSTIFRMGIQREILNSSMDLSSKETSIKSKSFDLGKYFNNFKKYSEIGVFIWKI